MVNDTSEQPSRKKTVQFDEIFNTPKELLTPSLNKITPRYKNPEERSRQSVAPFSTLVRPNYDDILRRVSVVIHQHIQKCEQHVSKLKKGEADTSLFNLSLIDKFSDEFYRSPLYVYHFVRAPIARMGFMYGIRKVKSQSSIPAVQEIYEFATDLFMKARLSAECSIVCLIYIERLMENGHVPLLGCTWRPILLCGLLLASKVWQDISSWNIEFANIYPQYSRQAINRLEMVFVKEVKWDLYISTTAYAKYYFAIRSLTEKQDFRRNYNIMMINAPGAQQIERHTREMVEAAVVSQSL